MHWNTTVKFLLIATAVVGILAASVPVTMAQEQSGWIVYSAKFMCGTRPTDVLAVTGKYETVINIHNPHYLPNNGVVFYKKAVRARTQRAEEFGEISDRKREVLPPDHARGVDCRDIFNLLYGGPPPFSFIEGFLVIEVPPQPLSPGGPEQIAPELDVVGAYTVRPRTGTAGGAPDATSLDIEIYDPRLIFGKPPQVD
jgi:hypothetical protein